MQITLGLHYYHLDGDKSGGQREGVWVIGRVHHNLYMKDLGRNGKCLGVDMRKCMGLSLWWWEVNLIGGRD